jgi:ELWxxDGT repeat protein
LGDVGGKLFFGTGGTAGGGLWTTDGTAAATTQVVPLQAMSGDVAFDYISDFHGQAIFQFADRQGLFRSDGTAAGTKQIAPLAPQQAKGVVPAVTVENAFYVAADNGTRLWRSDGTANGTSLVARFALNSISFATAVGGQLFFYAGDEKTLQTGLYASEGTAAGTQRVRALTLFSPNGSPHDVAATEEEFFFRASDPKTGVELWRSDGTADGTHIVRNIDVSGYGFEFGQTVAVGNKAYCLTPLDAQFHASLWMSDGTDAGTVPVRVVNFTPDTPGSGLSDLIVGGSRLFFTAYDAGKQQSTVWTSDGTAAGTVPVARPGNGSALTIANLTAVGDSVFFEILTGDGTDQLWRITDTAPVAGATTVGPGVRTAALVFDGSRFGDKGHVLGNFTPVGTTLFFTLTHDNEPDLWEVDTTTGDVSLVGNVSATNLAAFNGMLVFNGDDGSGEQLWESDGTFSGTVPIADVLLRDPGTGPLILPVGNVFYFRGYRSDTGDQLWKSDGTPDGTVMVKQVAHGQDGPRNLTAVGNKVFFLAKNAAGDDALWETNGTLNGTAPLVPDLGPEPAEIAGFHSALYFGALLDPAVGMELYRTDGTAAGISLVKDIYPGPGSSSPSGFIATETTLFFDVVDDGLRHQATYALTDSPVALLGRIFNDLNHNGVDDNNEPGLAHWTIYLDLNGNGVLDAGEPSTTTDIAGRYQFTALPPGPANVREVVQVGYHHTGQTIANGPAAVFELGDAQGATVLLDFAYLLTLAQHYGSAGTFATGDLNGDGKVNFADLLVLAQKYGHSLVDSAVPHKSR